jgi:CBS domain-containing protein
MNIGEICTREVVLAKRDTTALAAARLMRHYHVGNLLVVDDSNGHSRPIGIVTDRDLVTEIMAEGVDPDSVNIGELVTRKLVTVSEAEGVFETVQRMRLEGIKRMPVVDDQGALVGIVTVDDLIEVLAEEMTALSKIYTAEQKQERRTRP